MIKLTKGKIAVLALTATPMAAVGIGGAVATYVNMNNVLHRTASALGLVAAGEGATLICALIALAVTLMGQHTPATVRLGMWLVPVMASGVGIALAPNTDEMVVMGATPMAMTAAGEGIAFVARRVVAYQTNVDVEQQRRSGLLLWHANRAVNGKGFGKKISEAAVWRLTRQFATTDAQLSVQLGEVQRTQISQGAAMNLSVVLGLTSQAPSDGLYELPAMGETPIPYELGYEAQVTSGEGVIDYVKFFKDEMAGARMTEDEGNDFIQGLLNENETRNSGALIKLLSSDDVAVQLNVKGATVRSWVHRGKLRVHDRDAHGRALFHPDDVKALHSA